MSDYKEQVNSLREHADLIETSIELYGPSATRLLVYDLRNAAAAIEALQAEVKDAFNRGYNAGYTAGIGYMSFKREKEPKRGERTINPYESTWAIENWYI